MKATLSLFDTTLAYGDLGATSNPQRKYVDWSSSRSYAVENPKNDPFTVEPGETVAVFSTVRSTGVGADTEFTISLNPLSNSTYRFTKTAGTAPALRTDRALTLIGNTVTFVVNGNQTVTATSGLAAGFSAVVAGDVVFIPGASTGDSASPFDSANEGYWTVLAKTSSTVLQLARPSTQSFLATAEVVTVAANSQFQAYSEAGVQVGDSVDIIAVFPAAVLKKYIVTAVNPNWFEVTSTLPLPIGTAAVPGTAGIAFYDGAKRYLMVVFDQECSLTLNGITGAVRLSPWVAGDDENTGCYKQPGPVWSLSVTNRSTTTLNLLVVSAE